MNISLFSPIYPGPTHNPQEKLGCLRFTTEFFNFGQTGYRVVTLVNDPALYLEATNSQKPSWLSVVVRVIAILTIIIPLLMLVGALIYRAANKFELKDRFSELTPDILKLINNYAVLDSKSISQVNKKINHIFNENVDLNKNKLIAIAVENSLKTAELIARREGKKYYYELAQPLQDLDKVPAIAVFNRIEALLFTYRRIKPINVDNLRKHNYIQCYAQYHREKAIQLAHEMNELDKERAYACIAKEYVKVEPESALMWVRSLERKYHFEPLCQIVRACHDTILAKELIQEMLEGGGSGIVLAGLMAPFDKQRAIEIANLCQPEYAQVQALTEIIITIKDDHLSEALQVARTVLDMRSHSPVESQDRYFTLAMALIF